MYCFECKYNQLGKCSKDNKKCDMFSIYMGFDVYEVLCRYEHTDSELISCKNCKIKCKNK